MPAENAQKGMRPAWWKAKDGGAPLIPEIMPKMDSPTHHSFSGEQMEEMIWNRYNNTKWRNKDADLFVGGGKAAAVRRMQAWDQHKKDWEGSERSQMEQYAIVAAQQLWWRRYHDFVENGGDPAPHPRLSKDYSPYRRQGAITAMCA